MVRRADDVLIVDVENVRKSYRLGETAIPALRGVSLKVEKGEFLSIVGPSGSGKTTLLNLMGALDRPDEGRISLDGSDLSTLSDKERARLRREKIGFVFQTFNLIPVLTAYENVAFALHLLNLSGEEIRERTMRMLREVGLEGMEDRFPSQLSGGQQQRVAIARALVKEPIMVLADEPTANLDSETGESIVHLMRELNERYRTTFIFSTHDPMVMRHARRIVRLKDGLIVEDIKGGGE